MKEGEVVGLRRLERAVVDWESRHGGPASWVFFHEKLVVVFKDKFRVIAFQTRDRKYEIRKVGYPSYLKRK